MLHQTFTAGVGQDVFNLTTFTYTLGTNSLLIFKDGAVLDPPNPNPVDFTETSTSQFQLATPCTGGETIIAFGFVGITGTMPSIISDLMVANYQAIREYTDTAEILYAKGAVTSVDGGESYFQLTTGQPPGTYVDDNATVLVPTGGDGSSAWIRTKGIPVPIPGVAPAHKKGLIYYDAITNTFTGFNDISDVALNFGEEMWARVKNNTGSDITNGQALCINGVSSGLPTVELAQADDRTTAEMVGIATHNIPDGTEGIITTFGLVRGVNTFGLTGGQMIWLSPAVAGAVTTTKPTTDNYIVEIGNVMNVDAVNGTFFVRVTHPIDYTDINITGKSDALVSRELIGLTTANNVTDSAHDIDVTAGSCYDSTLTTVLTGVAQTKQIDAIWASGTNAGGRASAVALTAATWYHFFITDDGAGGTEYGWDTSVSATNLLADTGGSKYRLLASHKTDGSADITAFVQYGNEILLSVPVSDYTLTTPGTTANTVTAAVPTGYAVLADIYVRLAHTTDCFVYLSSLAQSDVAASATTGQIQTTANAQRGSVQLLMRTNTSAQYRVRSSLGTVTGLRGFTRGWTMDRSAV
jgi:hypothetical protein